VIRRVVFRPAAVRDLARLDRVVQARIDAALVRFAATGHGDVKSLKDRPGELRLRVGRWRVFFCLEPPDSIRVLGIDNRGEAYRSPTTPDDLMGPSAEGQAKKGTPPTASSPIAPVTRRSRRL
jgi:mRNA interferase RelE/StbE